MDNNISMHLVIAFSGVCLFSFDLLNISTALASYLNVLRNENVLLETLPLEYKEPLVMPRTWDKFLCRQSNKSVYKVQ